MIIALLEQNLATPIGTFVAGVEVHLINYGDPDARVCVCHTPTSCHTVPVTAVHLDCVEEVPDLIVAPKPPVEMVPVDVMYVDARYPQLVS